MELFQSLGPAWAILRTIRNILQIAFFTITCHLHERNVCPSQLHKPQHAWPLRSYCSTDTKPVVELLTLVPNFKAHEPELVWHPELTRQIKEFELEQERRRHNPNTDVCMCSIVPKKKDLLSPPSRCKNPSFSHSSPPLHPFLWIVALTLASPAPKERTKYTNTPLLLLCLSLSALVCLQRSCPPRPEEARRHDTTAQLVARLRPITATRGSRLPNSNNNAIQN